MANFCSSCLFLVGQALSLPGETRSKLVRLLRCREAKVHQKLCRNHIHWARREPALPSSCCVPSPLQWEEREAERGRMGRVGTLGRGFGWDGGEGTRPFSLPPPACRGPPRESLGGGRGGPGQGRGRRRPVSTFLALLVVFGSFVPLASRPLLRPPGPAGPPPAPPRRLCLRGAGGSSRRGRGRCPGRGGTRYLGRGGARARGASAGVQGGPRPLALGGRTLCYRGSFDHCVALARLGGTSRPRALAAPGDVQHPSWR